jgi:hypothetical protein
MSTVRDQHREAMDLADRADLEKRRGNLDSARQLYAEAFELEKSAAIPFASRYNDEPSRSILYRSAASLAIDSQQFDEAERLIATALSGFPPPDIADELRDLLEQIYFQRHLRLHGMELTSNELQVSMSGHEVSTGVIPSEVFLTRIKDVEKVVLRTAERLQNRPFRERGATPKDVSDGFRVFLKVPRPGSFSVTLQLGMQLSLPNMEGSPESVVDELMECLHLLNEGQKEALEVRFEGQPAYYRNFVGLARKIAPDGKALSLVGFTSIRNEKEQTVQLTKTPDNIALPSGDDEDSTDESGETATFTGELRSADSTASANKIRLINEGLKSPVIIVAEGLLNDIVRPMWEDTVEVVAQKRKNGKFYLVDIRKLE